MYNVSYLIFYLCNRNKYKAICNSFYKLENKFKNSKKEH